LVLLLRRLLRIVILVCVRLLLLVLLIRLTGLHIGGGRLSELLAVRGLIVRGLHGLLLLILRLWRLWLLVLLRLLIRCIHTTVSRVLISTHWGGQHTQFEFVNVECTRVRQQLKSNALLHRLRIIVAPAPN
jgi:hypothetical protein